MPPSNGCKWTLESHIKYQASTLPCVVANSSIYANTDSLTPSLRFSCCNVCTAIRAPMGCAPTNASGSASRPGPVAIDVKEQERFPQRSDLFLAQAIFGGNRSYILQGTRPQTGFESQIIKQLV